jgi:hypothetical protein
MLPLISRVMQGRYGYLVKWKGYDETHNSWVDELDAGYVVLLFSRAHQQIKRD